MISNEAHIIKHTNPHTGEVTYKGCGIWVDDPTSATLLTRSEARDFLIRHGLDTDDYQVVPFAAEYKATGAKF